VYREEALLRSGRDELRADEITAEEGGKKVSAAGQVVSILNPKNPDKDAAPVEARAKSMVYDERIGRIDYEGDVVMRHGEVTTKSPRSTVVLTADGRDFQRLEASPRVVIEQGKRQATGDSAIYLPGEKTVTLSGHVGLKDEQGQTLRGRRLTFRLDEETVHVDGREEARTETVLQKGSGLP
jgi:lipopolysaccharide transport protein LptA